MREIKFRVHNEETGEVLAYETFNGCINWGYHYVLAKELETLKGEAVCHAPPEYFKHPHPFGKLRRVLFTGLHDRNGVEIYEGDILYPGLREVCFGDWACLSDDVDKTPYTQGNGFYTRSYEMAGIYHKMPHSFNHRQSEDCAVIGNIHEHHHLLEAADA